ncbi:CBS domain-containing protein [Altericista sp. CCNU0014]|uniref:CBS domain-containing protein n=1 Tax=Altericista sp. CCNU0014 TaxID=3082949 RepID=UPI00384FDFC9
MDVVLCHRTADFDVLGAAVGCARLNPGTRIVLCGGAHPAVRDFLALYRDEYPLIERRSVSPAQLRTITVVDAQRRELLGLAAEWLDLPHVEVRLYDHHIQAERDIAAQSVQIEAVGSTTTLIVELLRAQTLSLSVAEATVMALGIHVDTGSLTYDRATPRDAAALTWLMERGANQRAIATYIEPGFSAALQDLLGDALSQLKTQTVSGQRLAWVLLSTSHHVPGLSSLASQLMVLSESDALLLGHYYQTRSSQKDRFTIIARSRINGVDLTELLKPLGGGGHPQAAAATLPVGDPQPVLDRLVAQLAAQVPQPAIAADVMSSPVRTILPDTSIDRARRILLRYGHSGLSVVDAEGQLVGILSRRDLDIALHHGFGHAPVKGYMSAPVRTIAPETTLPEIEDLMVTYDIGRLPVLRDRQLVGIVTRTDLLRQLHHLKQGQNQDRSTTPQKSVPQRLDRALPPKLREILAIAAAAAQAQDWQLYLVGGAVRDLLLVPEDGSVTFREFDLVVDGENARQSQGAGVELARRLQAHFPEAQLQVYGQFQTASLLWREGSDLGSFTVDIATARSEFYPYPAANPEVTASSIRQDLYRRDFTVNALALRLTRQGLQRSQTAELLDFFGGLEDLQKHQIRVLHPNSFIEDPTRIFRAIRFATRLGFALEPQTEAYIRHAIASGIYQHIQKNGSKAPALQARLQNELKYIFKLPNWSDALKLMTHLDALQCIHPDLSLDRDGWQRIEIAMDWHDRFDPQGKQIAAWLLMLEMLLLSLPNSQRDTVVTQLHLTEQTKARFNTLTSASAQLDALIENSSDPNLNGSVAPSRVVAILKSYDLPLLIELAANTSNPMTKELIEGYLARWQNVKPLLTGTDLIQMGYQRGPGFKPILDAVLSATLDGVVQTREAAIAWVQARFPNPGA